MIDIETLGREFHSDIVSIGAIEFDPEENSLGRDFYQVVSLEALPYINTNTLRWWMQQSEEARAVFKETGQPIECSLTLLSQFILSIKQNQGIRVWSRGKMDIDILEHKYKMNNLQCPWEYNEVRDARTFIDELTPYVPCFKFENKKAHNALSDAIYQASQVNHIHQYLRKI